MHLEAEIVYVRDALGGRDEVSLEMHSEAEIEKLRNALGGEDEVELRDGHGGRHWPSFEMCLDAEIV